MTQKKIQEGNDIYVLHKWGEDVFVVYLVSKQQIWWNPIPLIVILIITIIIMIIVIIIIFLH